MKAIIIKGMEMPENNGFIDVRIYADGKVLIPCAMGNCSTVTAEEIDYQEEE